MQNHPYVVVYRLHGDADWSLASLRLREDPADAANAAADWVRAQLGSLGLDPTTVKDHVFTTRKQVREHPGKPVTVTLPGREDPLLHVMAATIAIPATERNTTA